MGLRGIQPKPNHLRKLEGFPGHGRSKDDDDKAPKCKTLKPPAKFCEERCKIWDEVTWDLAMMEGLSAVDRRALELFVDILWRLEKVRAQLDGMSSLTMTIKDAKGQARSAKTVPQFQQYDRLLSQALRYCQNFGLTPSARVRLTLIGAGFNEPEDPFA